MITETPAPHPNSVIPPWNAPKKSAMTDAAYKRRAFIVEPIARATAKQSIERPIPTSDGVRRSMVSWTSRKGTMIRSCFTRTDDQPPVIMCQTECQKSTFFFIFNFKHDIHIKGIS